MLSQVHEESITQGFSWGILPKEYKTVLHIIFHVQCCLEPLVQHSTGFFMCNVVTRVSRQHFTESLAEQCCLNPLRQNYNFAKDSKLRKVIPGVLRQHCRNYFFFCW